jgi:hypothetical protein
MKVDMSLYAQYAKELLNRSVIETDEGFITYQYPDNNTVYIENLYIIPTARKSYAASSLANRVSEEAKAKGCNKMLGSVVPSANNSTDSVKVLLAYGFKLDSATNDFILFSKSLERAG